MAAADNFGEMFYMSFCFHDVTGLSWVVLGLSRQQYIVYDNKISPTMYAIFTYVNSCYTNNSTE